MLRFVSHWFLSCGCLTILCLTSPVSIFPQDIDSAAIQHFKSAQEAQNAGNLELAAKEYQQVIRLRPLTAEAYASLGLVYNAQGKLADSAQALTKAEKLKPGLPGVSFYLGIDYASLNQASLAVPRLKEAIRLEPDNKQAQIWLGRALWENNETHAALEQLSATVTQFPSDFALLFSLGENYRKAANLGIRMVVSKAKDGALAHQVYGDIYRDQQSWEKARAHYYRALELDTHWQGAHFGLAEVALHREKLDDAAQEYRRELQTNPSSAASLARLGEIQLLKGKPAEALALFSSAIHLAPAQSSNALGLPRAYPATRESLSEAALDQLRQCLPALEDAPASPARDLALSVIYLSFGKDKEDAFLAHWNAYRAIIHRSSSSSLYERGIDNYYYQDFGAAEADLYKWLKIHPDDLQAHYLLARIYRNLSQVTLEKLLTIAPDSYSAHQFLAENYQNADKNEQALNEYRIVAQMAPNLPGLHFLMGHLLLKMERLDEAKSELALELRAHPDHAEANAEMGTILLTQLQQEQAIPYLAKAVQLNPNLWTTYRQLGKAFYQQKDYKKAETALLQAIQHDPDGLAHYQLGMVYRDLGQNEGAREQFDISRKLKLENLSHAETQMVGTLEAVPQ